MILASCGSPEPPPAAPAGALPALNEADSELNESEKALELPQVRLAALDLFEKRETAGSLERTAALLRYHWQRHPLSIDLNALLAEAHCRIVETCPLTKAENKPRHEKQRNAGKTHAKEAIRLEPKCGPAHYWYGHLLLHSADADRSYALLKQALSEFEEANKIIPGYDFCGPARMMGRIYFDTPRFLLGSTKKSIEWYETAVKAAPDFALNRVWLGEACASNGDKPKAREQLEMALALPVRPAHTREDTEARTKAREHLEKLGP